ncbi:hypothetical protein [Thalassiella azotivora]
MSDLHCPATVLVVDAGALGEPAERDRVVAALAGRRVAAAYVRTAPGSGDELAAALASALGCPAPMRCPDGDDPVGALADLHRGESVVLVAGATRQPVEAAGRGAVVVAAVVDGDGRLVHPLLERLTDGCGPTG